jgi:hypothetical protein
MSVEVFSALNLDAIANAVESDQTPPLRAAHGWTPEQFAHEQIRGLMRQVFFSSAAQPVRQVLFTAAQGQTDVAQLCRQVGEALALEVKGSVAVLCRGLPLVEDTRREEIGPDAIGSHAVEPDPLPLRDVAKRVRSNLWLLAEEEVVGLRKEAPGGTALYSRLCELRAEFDYSILEGRPAGLSSEAASLGQLTDGIVLVLAAHKTRRAAAKKIKENLEAARTRILGAVLSERTFPIPGPLYRCL